jgi:hypothetical protein
MKNISLISILALILSGCASLTQGTSQTLVFNIEPKETRCLVSRDGDGQIGIVTQSQNILHVSKDKDDIFVNCKADGYKPFLLKITSSASGAGVAGVAIDLGVVDLMTGAMWRYPDQHNIFLDKQENSVPPVGNVVSHTQSRTNEILQLEQELSTLASRHAEEKDLRDRLAELKRLTQSEFKDDLPMLLGKIPAAKPNPRIHVFAIGINDYADVPDVPFADRSAEQFAKIVEKLLGVQKQNTLVLTNADATSGRLRGRLRTLLNRLGPQDQLLLYYAGHGVPGKDGKSAYLLAQDGGPGSYEEPALRLEQLYADIAKSQVGAAKLFIDACFSGRSGKDSIVFEGIAPILVTPKQSFPDSQRLAVMTAGRGDQFSNQNKDSGHRLFSYHLMRAMLETSPSLEIGGLHNRLRQRVLDDSRRIGPEFEQEPELQGNSKLPLLN